MDSCRHPETVILLAHSVPAAASLPSHHHNHKFPHPKMFVEQVKFLACIRVQHTKHPSSERVTAHGVVPNCFFGVQGRSRSSSLDVTDRQSRSRCRCVGGNQRHKTWQTWQGRQGSLLLPLLLPGTGVPCEWERRDEDFGVQMKTTRVAKLSAFHTNAPVPSTSTVQIDS